MESTKYISESGQSLMDISIHHYGSVEGAKEIAKANGISPTAFIAGGTELVIPSLEVDQAVLSALKLRAIVPATSSLVQVLDGIDNDELELDLEVL